MVERANPSFTPEHLRFLEYLRAVGTGPKGNRDLSYDETRDAFELILHRRIPDTLISAFLLGWRVRGERGEELQACVDLLAERTAPHRGEGVEIGYPMDGKAKFPPIMLEAAALIPELPVHTAVDLPLGPKYGVTADQFPPFSSNVQLHRRGELIPELSALSGLRNDLGLRTAFNTLEKLYFLAPAALIGMHHAPYFDLYAALYQKHYRRLIIVQGHEGTPEILKKTKYKLVEGEQVSTHTIDPEEFGIAPIAAKETMDPDQMKSLLAHPDSNLVRMKVLNAAFIGWAAGLFSTTQEGYESLIRKVR